MTFNSLKGFFCVKLKYKQKTRYCAFVESNIDLRYCVIEKHACAEKKHECSYICLSRQRTIH